MSGAIKVFTEQGYSGASMDRVAEAAGASKRTVYNHFPSKEALFQAIIAEFIAEHDRIKPVEYAPDLPLAAQLRQFVQAELHLIDDPQRRALSKLLTATFLMDTKLGDEVRSEYEPHAAFIAWLEHARQDRRLTFPSADLAARVFYGLVEGCLTWNALLTDGATLANTEPTLDEMTAVFLARYQTVGYQPGQSG